MKTHEVLFGTEQHDKLLDYVLRLVRYGENGLSSFRERLRRDDELFYAYVTPPRGEKSGQKSNRVNEKGQAEYSTISIPYGYAMCLVCHTYFATTFLSRDPILQVKGRHAETAEQELAVESLLDYQITAGGARPVLSNWLMDGVKSGVGIIGCYWDTEYTTVGRIAEVPKVTIMGQDFSALFGTKRQYVEETIKSYDGNKIYPVRGLDFIWDTRFSIVDFQKGQFAGERLYIPTNIAAQKAEAGEYIRKNYEELEKNSISGTSWHRRLDSRAQEERDTQLPYLDANDRKYLIDAIDLSVELIPKDFGLSPSSRPTKYKITIGDEKVILACRPSGDYHQKHPYAVVPFEVDYYKKFPRSLINIVEPLENTLNYLLNQHFYNIRKHLNNQLIVDPSRVVISDLYQRQPGGLIRLRPEAYGTSDLKGVLQQLPVTDITRSNMADMRIVEELMQKVMGVNDNTMGLVNPGGRKTAQEVRMSSAFATNRLKVTAEWFSMTGWDALCQMMIQNTQQYFREENTVRVVGSTMAGMVQKFIKVSPEQIAGFYDFIPVDGTLPIDRQSIANILRDMFQQAVRLPQIGQAYDLPRLFEYIGELAGARNISRFRINVLQPGQAPPPGTVPVPMSMPNSPSGDLPPQPSQVEGNGNENLGPVG